MVHVNRSVYHMPSGMHGFDAQFLVRVMHASKVIARDTQLRLPTGMYTITTPPAHHAPLQINVYPSQLTMR